jgi:hypothetical protein
MLPRLRPMLRMWLVLRYLLFVTGEGQVENNPTVEIVRCRFGPEGPLAVRPIDYTEKVRILKKKSEYVLFYLYAQRERPPLLPPRSPGRRRRRRLTPRRRRLLLHLPRSHRRRSATAAAATSHADCLHGAAADVTSLAGNFLAVVAAWFLVALPSNSM